MSLRSNKLHIDSILQGLSTSRLGRRIILFDEIDSTNAKALEIAKEGGEEGTLVLAEVQTRGRGRAGRVWHSPKGLNLTLSLILRPSCSVREIPWLSLSAGVAVAQSIRNYTTLPARVKWPNDVVLNRKKVAGLLLEQSVRGDRAEAIVLGLGVNLNMEPSDFPDELVETATSLSIEGGREVKRVCFLQELLASLEAWYGIFLQSSYEKIQKDYLDLFELYGETVRIRTQSSSLVGKAVGLASDGALRVRLDQGEEVSVYTGDVIQVRAF